MSEFAIEHGVYELFRVLGVDENEDEGFTKEKIVEKFKHNRLTKHNNQRTVRNFIDEQMIVDKKFTDHYEQIKSKNVHETDSLIEFLSSVSKNSDLKHFFRLHKFCVTKFSRRPMQNALTAINGNDNTKQKITNKSFENFDEQLISTPLPPLTTTSRSSSKINNENEPPSMKANIEKAKKFNSLSLKLNREEKCSNFLSYNFTNEIFINNESLKPLSNFSQKEQENILIDELLKILIGIEGNYIKLNQNSNYFSVLNTDIVDKTCGQLLYTSVKRITDQCYYSELILFIEQPLNGIIAKAFQSCVRILIKDYYLLITELENMWKENHSLTIQKMWYYLLTFFDNFKLIADIIYLINNGNCEAAAILSILHEKILSLTGNEKLSSFLRKIMIEVCKPYFNILTKWINDGVINDTYDEFFINDSFQKVNENNSNDEEDDGDNFNENIYLTNDENEYRWRNRFSIIETKIPNFLKSFTNIILNTGKYLSIVHDFRCELNKQEQHSNGNNSTILSTINAENNVNTRNIELVYTTDERNYNEILKRSLNIASKQLLNLLLNEYDLYEHFSSIKKFFFMENGDFIRHFIDSANNELNKSLLNISPITLQFIFELQLENCFYNKYIDFLSIDLQRETLYEQINILMNKGKEFSIFNNLKISPICDDNDVFENEYNLNNEEEEGFKMLTLRYKSVWPLSLILNKESLGYYQMLFRLLFQIKFVESNLANSWLMNKNFYKNMRKSSAKFKFPYLLKQKMLHFVNSFQSILFTLINDDYNTFENNLHHKIKCIDDVIYEHESFREILSKHCLLSNINALEIILNLLDLCSNFSFIIIDDLYGSLSLTMLNKPKIILNETDIKDMDTKFNELLLKLISELKFEKDFQSTNTHSMLSKLDYNYFYENMQAN